MQDRVPRTKANGYYNARIPVPMQGLLDKEMEARISDPLVGHRYEGRKGMSSLIRDLIAEALVASAQMREGEGEG